MPTLYCTRGRDVGIHFPYKTNPVGIPKYPCTRVQPSSIYPSHISTMPTPSKISLHPQATIATIENARTDTVIQLAVTGVYSDGRIMEASLTLLAKHENLADSRVTVARHLSVAFGRSGLKPLHFTSENFSPQQNSENLTPHQHKCPTNIRISQ